MILLEVNQKLVIGGITITDWMQAFGALIAIIAGIVGYIKLFRKSSDTQIQINSLRKIAEQSDIQSQQLTAQVDQMIEGNKLQTDYIRLFQKSLEISEFAEKEREEYRELEKKRRKFEIRPRINPAGKAGGQETMKIFLINKGGVVRIEDMVKMKMDSCTDMNETPKGKEIKTNERFEILCKASPGGKLSQCNMSIRLTYSDNDNNRYYQIIEGNPKGKIRVNELVELE